MVPHADLTWSLPSHIFFPEFLSNLSRSVEVNTERTDSACSTTRTIAFASDAPVIVGSGLKEPLPLGAYVPYQQGGNLLHVWDWSKSSTSRVFKNIPFTQNHRYAVSPDGKRLVSSRGEIFDLETGEMEKIDLGDESYSHSGGSLRRIRGLAFTPDGGRVAMLILVISRQL